MYKKIHTKKNNKIDKYILFLNKLKKIDIDRYDFYYKNIYTYYLKSNDNDNYINDITNIFN